VDSDLAESVVVDRVLFDLLAGVFFCMYIQWWAVAARERNLAR
jgi:hypothetical protein